MTEAKARATAYLIREATASDVAHVEETFNRSIWSRPAGYFARLTAAAARGELRFLIATTETGQYVGHLKLIWRADHPNFRDNDIPEIQDLIVLPEHQRQGIASRLIAYAEMLAAERSDRIGIGVGLYADYGAAQRLYPKLGYRPIGDGLQYNNEPVPPGTSVPVDDSLTLVLIKELRPSLARIAREWPALYLRQGLARVHYPALTPAGNPIDLLSKNNGGGTQLHLISRGSQEVYFELAVYEAKPLTAAWERFLGAALATGKVTASAVEQVDVAGQNAERRLLIFPDKRRLVHFLRLDDQLCRLIYNPDAPLNEMILATLQWHTDFSF